MYNISTLVLLTLHTCALLTWNTHQKIITKYLNLCKNLTSQKIIQILALFFSFSFSCFENIKLKPRQKLQNITYIIHSFVFYFCLSCCRSHLLTANYNFTNIIPLYSIIIQVFLLILMSCIHIFVCPSSFNNTLQTFPSQRLSCWCQQETFSFHYQYCCSIILGQLHLSVYLLGDIRSLILIW